MLLNFFVDRFGAGAFIGEHLWLGHLGHFFIVLSFAASLLAFFSFFGAEFSHNQEVIKTWKRIARSAFIAHGFSVIGIFVLLFLMILNHRFEYHYAWRHSSTALPLKYIISSFWEGQEGSFLLWQFWLVILGFVGMKTLKNYELPVMGTISITQVFLGSMVLGVYFLGHKIGSNPFVLLRDEMNSAPVFQRANYLSLIQDGNGLNPLLQNYWMTIHPPALFLGFASVTIPFAFVISSLLRKDWDGWLKPALPWTLFSVAALGTGILMGGAWAYESLSFGGFWAWDPVENMSFVPWLMLVAGLHMMLVNRYTKHSLITTYIFLILSFVLVLYSTFLTRSGILGDTSVHAFTDLGMTAQLLLYMAFFLVLSFTLLLIRVIKKQIPSITKEEEFFSREFWMFIGSLILLLSAIQMIFTTSIPVWNLLFESFFKQLKMEKLAPPVDVVEHYNSIQVFLAILVALLTGLVQYLSYKSAKIPKTAKWAVFTFILSIIVSVFIAWGMNIDYTRQHAVDLSNISNNLFFKFPFLSTQYMLLIASLYAVFGNLAYMFLILKGKLKLSGGSIAHFGFGVFLLGVLISQGKKEVISLNRQGVNFGKEFNVSEKMENILLLRDSTLAMGEYEVTYTGVREAKPDNFYLVKYIRRDSATGKIKEQFTLEPNAQLNPKMGLIANPDTKHYLTKDIFTHVSSVPDNANLKDTVFTIEAAVGDTFIVKKSFAFIKALNPTPNLPDGFDKEGKLLAGVLVEVNTISGKKYEAEPVFIIDLKNGNSISSLPAEMKELDLTFQVERINPSDKKILLSVRETEKPLDFIILKAIIFPYINLVWLGGILTFLGALLSMYRRMKENQ